MQTSPNLLAEAMFECPQHTSQACTKTCIILRTRQVSPPLLHCNYASWNSRWKTSEQQDIIIEEKWSQKKTRKWSILIFFQNCHFLTYYILKTSTFIFGAQSFLFIHIWFTPSEGPTCFINWFVTMEVGPWSQTMEKCHPPWSNFMIHGIN